MGVDDFLLEEIDLVDEEENWHRLKLFKLGHLFEKDQRLFHLIL